MLLTYEIPIKTVSEANVSRKHWSDKQKRARIQREAVAFTLRPDFRQKKVVPLIVDKISRIRVEFTRLATGRLDDDNLASAFKAIRDEVAAQLGIDDGDDIYKFCYSQEKVEAADIGVIITITITEKTSGLCDQIEQILADNHVGSSTYSRPEVHRHKIASAVVDLLAKQKETL